MLHNAAVNTGVQIPLQDPFFISFGDTLRSGNPSAVQSILRLPCHALLSPHQGQSWTQETQRRNGDLDASFISPLPLLGLLALLHVALRLASWVDNWFERLKPSVF